MKHLTTHMVHGHYAYRAWDGDWYVVGRDGNWTGQSLATRQQAVSAMKEA